MQSIVTIHELNNVKNYDKIEEINIKQVAPMELYLYYHIHKFTRLKKIKIKLCRDKNANILNYILNNFDNLDEIDATIFALDNDVNNLMKFGLVTKIIKNKKKSHITILYNFETPRTTTEQESQNYINSALNNLPNTLEKLSIHNNFLYEVTTINFPSSLTNIVIYFEGDEDSKRKLLKKVNNMKIPFDCIVSYENIKVKNNQFMGCGRKFNSISWIG